MKYFIVGLVKIYQLLPISTHNLCRFKPTCSEYMIESIKEYGLIKGLHLGIKRILKCHPGGKYGYDPVPKRKDSL